MRYGGVNAKVKAMKSRLLSANDYYNLSASENVHEAWLKLRNFSEYTQSVDTLIAPGADNRYMYEAQLALVADNNYFKIHGFLSDSNTKKYLNAWFLKREIQVIKHMLGNFYGKRDVGRNVRYTQGLHFFDIDINALGQADNIDLFLKILSENKFFRILKDVYQITPGLFEMEIALDFNYYKNLQQAKRKFLKGDDLKAATIIDGSEADMQNILWIYRLKAYCRMERESVYKYVMPIHYRIKPENIIKLVEANRANPREILSETPCAYAFEEFGDIEQSYFSATKRAYRQAVSRYPNSLAIIAEYLFMKNIEIRNVISVFEGVRYCLEPDEIMERIFVQRVERVKVNA